MPFIPAVAMRGLTVSAAADYTPLHHGGDAHSPLWWITFLAVVVTALVVAMSACLVCAVRASQTTAEQAAARADRRAARAGRAARRHA